MVSRMRISRNYSLKDLGDNNFVIINTTSDIVDMENLITLNETAGFMFKLLEESKSDEEIIAKMTEVYNTSGEKVARDLNTFKGKLKELMILEQD